MKPKCAITNLPITYKDKVVIFLLEPNDSLDKEYDQPYIFASLPIFCTYDDFYYVEDVVMDINVEIIELFYKKSIYDIVIVVNDEFPKLYMLHAAYDIFLAKHKELYPEYFEVANYSRNWTRLTEWNSRKWESMEIFYNWKTKNFFYDIEYFALSDKIDWDKENKKQEEINQLNSTLVKRYIELFLHGRTHDVQLENISRLYNMMGKCNLTIEPFKPIAIHGIENLLNQRWLLEMSAEICKNLIIDLYESDDD